MPHGVNSGRRRQDEAREVERQSWEVVHRGGGGHWSGQERKPWTPPTRKRNHNRSNLAFYAIAGVVLWVVSPSRSELCQLCSFCIEQPLKVLLTFLNRVENLYAMRVLELKTLASSCVTE